MSGMKVSMASIPQSTLNRLYSDQSRLHSLEQSIPEMRRRMQRDYELRCEEISRRSDARIYQLNCQISRLGKDMVEQERNLQNQLSKQREALNGAVKQFTNDLHSLDAKVAQNFGQMRRQMESTAKQLRSEMLQQAEILDQKICSVDQRVQTLEKQNEYARQMTEQWLTYAQMQYDLVVAVPDYDRFAKGCLKDFDSQLAGVRQDLANGAFQASLPQARTISRGLNNLRFEVESAYELWQNARNLALAKGLNFQDILSRNEKIEAVGADGNLLPGITLETNYWTEGAYAKLISKLAADVEILEEQSCQWDTDRLQEWLEKDLPSYERELEELTTKTRLAALLSQFRTEMGYELYDSFRAQGYVLEGGIDELLFEDLDPRKALIADLISRDGARVAIKISPDLEEFRNSLEIHSFDAGFVPESQLRQRQADINKLLGQELQLEMTPSNMQPRPDPTVRQSFAKASSKLTQSL